MKLTQRQAAGILGLIELSVWDRKSNESRPLWRHDGWESPSQPWRGGSDLRVGPADASQQQLDGFWPRQAAELLLAWFEYRRPCHAMNRQESIRHR